MGVGELSIQGAVGIVVSILGSWAAIIGILLNAFTNTLRRVEGELSCIRSLYSELDKRLAVWVIEAEHTKEQMTKMINKCEGRHEQRD